MAVTNMISPVLMDTYVTLWINEDTPNFDLSFIASVSKEIMANIEMKSKGVVAGFPFAEAIFNYLDCKVEWRCLEGSFIEDKTVIGQVRGLSSKIIIAERTALNILGRASGIATIARRVNTKVSSKWKGQVLGSRRTNPGMKMVEKYAMYIGGFTAPRYGLSTIVTLGDSDIKSNGGIEKTFKMIKEKVGRMVIVEVKCSTKQEALEAASVGANVVILNNFKSQDIRTLSKQVKDAHPSVLVEVSGGINESNILDYAVPNVDIISSNIFSQGYKSVDLILNISTVPVCFTREIVETVIDVFAPIALDQIDVTINGKTNTSEVLGTETKRTPKPGIKRKIDEVSGKTEDNKINTVALENSKKDFKKVEEKTSSKDKVPAKIEKSAAKQQKLGVINKSVYNMKSFGSARMPGHPVGSSTPGVRTMHNSNIFRAMAAGLALTFPGGRSHDVLTLFRAATNPIRYGGSAARVSMNRLGDNRMTSPYRPNTGSKYLCKSCNFQNPSNGPPVCRVCRKLLF